MFKQVNGLFQTQQYMGLRFYVQFEIIYTILTLCNQGRYQIFFSVCFSLKCKNGFGLPRTNQIHRKNEKILGWNYQSINILFFSNEYYIIFLTADQKAALLK